MKKRFAAITAFAILFAAIVPTASQAFVNVEIGVAPPPPRVEVVPIAPRPHVVWVPGYWRWDGGQHVWVGGRYIAERPGYHWVPEHWVQRGPNWRFVPGHWAP